MMVMWASMVREGKMLPWEKPDYLNIEWPKQNRLATPNKRVPLIEALGMEFCQGWSGLQGINFDGVLVDDLYMSAHYRFYDSRAYVVCTKYMSRDKAEKLIAERGGDIMEYGTKDSVYYVLAFRVGCTHPNMADGWTDMHTRVQECPDCGYKAKFDTSD
jgi:hypothetical protein